LAADDAGHRALAEGALWIARNADTLATIRPPVTVTRWQDWTGRAEFGGAQRAILDHAKADALFAEAVEVDAGAPAARKARRGEVVPAAWVDHSRDYVTEELAVFALQCARLPAAEVYPGGNLAAADYLAGRKGLSDEIRPLAARHFTRIDFSRINVAPAAAPALRPSFG